MCETVKTVLFLVFPVLHFWIVCSISYSNLLLLCKDKTHFAKFTSATAYFLVLFHVFFMLHFFQRNRFVSERLPSECLCTPDIANLYNIYYLSDYLYKL